jgi:hypothetical protein
MLIEERNSGDPVAGGNAAVALYIVLPAGEIPHEIAPVHVVDLVAEKEFQVLPESGLLVQVGYTAPVVHIPCYGS